MPYIPFLGTLAPTYHKLDQGTLALGSCPRYETRVVDKTSPVLLYTDYSGMGGLTLQVYYCVTTCIADPLVSKPPTQASTHTGLPTFTPSAGAAGSGLELLTAASRTAPAGDGPTINMKPETSSSTSLGHSTQWPHWYPRWPKRSWS